MLLGRGEVSQRYRGEARTETRHSVKMHLLRNPSSIVLPPSYPGASLLRLLAAPITPQDGTDDAELGEKDVDHGSPTPRECRVGKDGGNTDTHGIGCLWSWTAFVDELGNGGLGEDVQ